MKSSANEPPAVPASAMMAAAATNHAAIVIQGRRALAVPRRRVKAFMPEIVCAGGGSGLPAADGLSLPPPGGKRARTLRPAGEAGPRSRADDGDPRRAYRERGYISAYGSG